MKSFKNICLIVLCLSVFVNSAISVASTGIAFSDESVNSLSISSSRSQDHVLYILEIYIEGIPASKVNFKTNLQTLYLSANKGGVASKNAIAGTQRVNLAFNFPANANLKSFYRENLKNKIIISIPKFQTNVRRHN